MIEYQYVEKNQQGYVECLPGGGMLSSEQDALDLVAACGEYGTGNLLIHVENLPEEFFQLKTGLLGAVLLKFNLYQMRAAAVIPPEKVTGRFAEFAIETNWSREFRIYPTRDAAEAWLVGQT